MVSILVPVFNEAEFLGELLRRVQSAPLPRGMEREIIVVDDGSTDGSGTIAEASGARVIRHATNRGKGAAVRTAIGHARGEFALIQDADLEYNPAEYGALLEPLLDGAADVVYGSRFATTGRRRVLYFWHAVANRALTSVCNLVSDLNLTDMGTGYKAFRTSLLRTIPLRSDGFAIEPEITIKLAKRQARFYEVPISYEGRTYDDGKKIRWSDAARIVGAILRWWFSHDLYCDRGAEILDAFSVAPHFNRWMADTIRPYVGKRVLEIGAGMGNLTRHFVNGRDRYIATDVDGEHLARLRNRLRHQVRLEVRVCDLSNPEHFRPLAGSADTVICLNVLEHMADDRQCLTNLYRALDQGGTAVVLVPEGEALFGHLDAALGHFRRYSEPALRAAMEGAGFAVERVIAFNRISRPGWYLKGRVLRQSRLGRLHIRAFDSLVWLWRRIDGALPWGPTSLIAIARK